MDQKIFAARQRATELLNQFCQEQDRELIRLAKRIATLFAEGGQLLVAGNGVLQPVAQQLASHFSFRLSFDRPALPAICLGSDTVLTGQMFSAGQFDQYLVRHYRTLNTQNHLVLILNDGGSTEELKQLCDEVVENDQPLALISCNSANDPLNAVAVEVALDLATSAPPRQIELAQFVGHLLCELVEAELFGC